MPLAGTRCPRSERGCAVRRQEPAGAGLAPGSGPAEADAAGPVQHAGSEVAGFIILLFRPGYLLLENVAGLPAVQGRGIGARLLALAEDRARVLHVSEIRLYANAVMTENLAHYPRHGYTETPPGPAGRLPPCLLPQTGGHLTARIAA
jgi:GNAT superfamily N-acetyltransferase